jgi:type II secretory pathway predicted ATPase ExeA
VSDDPNDRVEDAFGFTADPKAYFPRVALEAALADLVAALDQDPPCAALIGEPGLGKTLLLHVLEERLEGAFECVYMPYPRLNAIELWAWIAGAIGLEPSRDDRAAVLRRARRRHEADGTGFLLLVDDAAALLPEPRVELIHACRTPGFGLVMAFASDDREAIESLPEHVRRIDLGPPMTLAETRAYVRARLRRVDPEGALAKLLGAARISELHEASEGVPARLHALLDEWLRGSPAAATPAAAPPAPAPTPVATLPPREVREPREPEPVAEPPPPPAELPRSVVELRPPLVAEAPLERRQFFERRRSKAPLALALLVALVVAGLWITRGREPAELAPEAAPPPAVAPVDPPRAEAAPPAPPVVEEPAAPIAEPEEAAPPEPAPEAIAAAEPSEPEPPPAPAPTEEAAPPEVAVAPPAEAPAPEPSPAEPPPAVAEAAPPPAPEPEPTPPPRAAAPAPAPEPAPAPPPALAALDVPPLAPPPPGPRLSIQSTPSAQIELDGKAMGETPLGELRIAPGPHVVRARLPDGRVLQHRFEADEGDFYLVFP